jgi:formylglycine-generating enzyme required for sulfatase activity
MAHRRRVLLVATGLTLASLAVRAQQFLPMTSGNAFGLTAGGEELLRAVNATNATTRLNELGSTPGVPQTDARRVTTWVTIPAGTFEMGCVPGDGACDGDERPRHTVTISRPFQLMTTEVTVGSFGPRR